MHLSGLGPADGKFELDDTKLVNGMPTYWRNDGDAFWYNCGPHFRMQWAIVPKELYSAKMECQGWATALAMPAEDVEGMEVNADGVWKGVVPGTATAELTSNRCSAARDSEVHNSDGECMRIKGLSAAADGDYSKDASKMINGAPTIWKADKSSYWFFCGPDTPFWMLSTGANWDHHTVLDADKIQKMAAGTFGFWGVKCRGMFQ